MSVSDPIRAWQAPVPEAPLPAIEEVRVRTDRFFRLVRLRNRIEYVAAVFVVLCFTAYAFLLPSPVARVGAALVVVGTLFVVWQLHRRASAAPPPAAEAALPLIAHQRAQLARQRDALASVGMWYLLPFVPGLAVMMLGPTIARDPSALLRMPLSNALFMLLVVVVFAAIRWANRRMARRLQRAIDELDMLTGETE